MTHLGYAHKRCIPKRGGYQPRTMKGEALPPPKEK